MSGRRSRDCARDGASTVAGLANTTLAFFGLGGGTALVAMDLRPQLCARVK